VLISSELDGFDQRLFENLAPTVRALRRLFQNVIRHTRIGAGNAVENIVERNLGTLGIAVFAGFDQPLGSAQSCGVDENNNLLFWTGIEKIHQHKNTT